MSASDGQLMRSRSSQRRRRFTATNLLLVTVMTFGLGVLESGATVSNSPNLATLKSEVMAATKLRTVPSPTVPPLTWSMSSSQFSLPAIIHQCNPQLASPYVPSCSFGDLSAKTTVVLYGNSWAQQWVPTFDALGRADHFRLVSIAKPACGTFVEAGYVDPLGHVSTICQRFVTWAVREMNRLRPSTIVVSSTLGNLLKPGASRFAYGPDGRLPNSLLVAPTKQQASLAFHRLVTALAPSRARIVLVGNIPVPRIGTFVGGTTPNQCLLANLAHIQRCSVPTPTAANSTNRVSLMSAAAVAEVPFIDVNALFCANGSCPLVVNRILVHFNTIHVSRPYARYLATAFGQLMGNLLPRR